MAGILYGRNPDEPAGEIHLWVDTPQTVTSECGKHTYDILEINSSAVKVDFETQQKILRIIQTESLREPLPSYCDECVQQCGRL